MITHLKTRTKGVALSLFGITLLSPDSLLLRLINADVWTLVFWRGGLSAVDQYHQCVVSTARNVVLHQRNWQWPTRESQNANHLKGRAQIARYIDYLIAAKEESQSEILCEFVMSFT